MDPEIHQFVSMFKDENDLQGAIASMLRSIPGVSGVEITQGPHEHGKDIVFNCAGGLGESLLYACVIKNERITGSVSSKSGAKTVLFQAEQAFDEPYISGAGAKMKVQHVYIMSPYECSQSAMDSIDERLAHRQVTFVCGGKLLDVFRQYCPEFLMFNSSVLSSYVANLKRGMDEDSPLRYLSSQHALLGPAIQTFSKIYVKQDFYQVFHQHKLGLKIPDLVELQHPISGERLTELQSALRQLAAFVGVSEIWSSVERSNRQRIESALIEWAKELKNLWDKGYERDEREKSRRGEPVPTRRDAYVTVVNPELILTQYGDASSLVRLLAQELAPIVARANEFAAVQPPATSKTLRSPAFLDYSMVSEVSRRNQGTLISQLPGVRVEFPHALIREVASPVLITGPAGFGKSSYCKWNALADITDLTKDKRARLPVYVPLHQLSREGSQSPTDTFLRASELRELVADRRYADSIAGIRLYLDGLDEVASTERQAELLTLAHQLCEEDHRFAVILTAREHVGGRWLNWMPRIRICELSEEQSDELVAKWLQDEKQRDEFHRQVALAPTLRALLRVPLLATLIIAVFRKSQQLPESRIRLYEMFVELMSGGWDLAKNIRREVKFGSIIKLGVLSRLASVLHMNERRDCSQAEIVSAMKDVIPESVSRSTELLQELVEDCLLVKSGNAYYFSHMSFQEYLAAKGIADPTGRRQTQILKWYLNGKDWWREVILFYVSMQTPQEAENWIRKTAEQMTVPSAQTANRLRHEFHFLMEYLKLTFPSYCPKEFDINLPKGRRSHEDLDDGDG